MRYPAIYLASKSSRRQQLLQQIAVPFTVLNTDIDEIIHRGEIANNYVVRMAREKADRGLQTIQQQAMKVKPILAADTCVIIDQHILGKPSNAIEAKHMLRQLAGRKHHVLTAIALAYNDTLLSTVSRSMVTFSPLTSQQIDAYIATQEPMDKAGAYGIQGLAAQFICYLEGSFSGVMGLPLYETAQLLQRCNDN